MSLESLSWVMFYLFAALAAVSAVGVVVTRNIVRMAVCLLFTLAAVAGLYLLLQAEFLAVAQIVVYVGGTLILIVFGIMLTAKSPSIRFTPRVWEVVVTAILSFVLLVALSAGLIEAGRRGEFASSASAGLTPGGIKQLGVALLSEYLVPFELVSVLLLVVMIGAAYLAKSLRHQDREQP